MKIIKALSVILAVCLCAVAVPLGAAAAAEPTIVVSDAVCSPGEDVQITVALKNNPGIVSMQLSVRFDDSILTLKSVSDAGELGTELHKPELTSPYTLAWANDTATENYTVNGTVVTLTFSVSETAQGGTVAPVEVEYNYDNYDIFNKDVELVYFAVDNGSVTVSAQVSVPIEDMSIGQSGTNLILRQYTGDDAELVFESTYIKGGTEYTFTAVDYYAFIENTTVTSIVFPETVISIEEGAFMGCSSLKTVTFLGTDVDINSMAFDLPSEITIIGYAGSSVEEYAKANGINFVALDDNVLLGDLDLNGKVDSADLVLMRKHLIGSEILDDSVLENADIHCDNVIDICDLVALKKITVGIK